MLGFSQVPTVRVGHRLVLSGVRVNSSMEPSPQGMNPMEGIHIPKLSAHGWVYSGPRKERTRRPGRVLATN